MKNIITTLILIVAISFSGFSQNDKMKETASEKVQELNEQIIAGDKNLALTQDQKDKIYELHIQRLTEIKSKRKEGAGKEDLKEVNQKYFKQIFDEVLTKDQKKARKAGKEDGED